MTKSLKYSLIALFAIVILFSINRSSQNSYKFDGKSIYTENSDLINRIIISEDKQQIELTKLDSTWFITGNDSLIVNDNKIENLYEKLLKVEQEMLITSKEEKWSRFGVDDSLGKHFILYNQEDNELLHYIFGNSGQDYQHNYIRKNKANDVYRTNDNVFFLLNTSDSYWGSLPIKEELPVPVD